ncbi:MAG: hypothetical protein ACM32F_05840, partial [Betaproteobacteria bacterium]
VRGSRLLETNANDSIIISKFIVRSLATPESWMDSRQGTFSTASKETFIRIVSFQPTVRRLPMKKLMSVLIATSFAAASAGAFAMSHGGAMSDADKAKKMEACKKMDAKTADDKMKADCKKLMDEANAAAKK